MLATSTFWTFFWEILWFFFLVIWLIILFHVIVDLFRDHEMSGIAKMLWVIFFIFIPFLAVIVYLITRGGGMARRTAEHQAAAQKQFDSYVKDVAGGGPSSADQIAKAKELLDKGTISQSEFDQLKAKALG